MIGMQGVITYFNVFGAMAGGITANGLIDRQDPIGAFQGFVLEGPKPFEKQPPLPVGPPRRAPPKIHIGVDVEGDYHRHP